MPDRYVLYTSNDFDLCRTVVDYLQRKHIDCLIINVDDEGDTPPLPVAMYPAMLHNDKLCAYGLDIIEHFQQV